MVFIKSVIYLGSDITPIQYPADPISVITALNLGADNSGAFLIQIMT